MDEQTAINFIADNSVVGATGAAALAFLYKIWRVLKVDRKEDNLDNAERSFREEIRAEVKELRALNDQLHRMNEKIQQEKHDCEVMITVLQARLKWLEVCFFQCQENHPGNCPLKHIWTAPDHSGHSDRRIIDHRRVTPGNSETITQGRRIASEDRRNEE